MTRSALTSLAMLAVQLVALVSGAPALAQTVPPKLLGPVEVGSGIDAAYAQFVVAERHGFWKACGVEVRLKLFPSGQEALEAVLMAQAFGASRLQVFRRITVPGVVSYALTGMRLAMGNSFMTVVTAEMLGAEEGLGYLLHSGRMFYRTDLIFVAIVLLGLLADRLFQLVVVQKLAWKYQPANR